MLARGHDRTESFFFSNCFSPSSATVTSRVCAPNCQSSIDGARIGPSRQKWYKSESFCSRFSSKLALPHALAPNTQCRFPFLLPTQFKARTEPINNNNLIYSGASMKSSSSDGLLLLLLLEAMWVLLRNHNNKRSGRVMQIAP